MMNAIANIFMYDIEIKIKIRLTIFKFKKLKFVKSLINHDTLKLKYK